MVSITSRRAQRQVKKGMIQPALPLIPVAKKSKADEPTAYEPPSISGEDTPTAHVAEPGDAASPRIHEASGDTRDESSSGYGGSADQLGSAQSPSQAELDYTRDNAQVEPTEETPAELNDTWTEPATTRGQNTELPSSQDRSPSSTLSERGATQADDKVSHEISDRQDIVTHSSGVATYETWQFGQPAYAEFISATDAEHSTSINKNPSQSAPVLLNGSDGTLPPQNADETSLGSAAADTRRSTSDQTSNAAATKEQDLPYGAGDTISANGSPNASRLASVAEHLLQMSHTKSWADWAVVVTGGVGPPFVTYAHAIMLLRSPRLRSLMEATVARQVAAPSSNVVNLYAPVPLVPHAFEAALRFLYSDAVLTAESTFPTTESARINFLPYILSYWMSGLLLGIDGIVARASMLLSDFVHWDVVELLMKQAEDMTNGVNQKHTGGFIDWTNVAAQWKAQALSFCAQQINPQTFRFDDISTSSLLPSRFANLEERPSKHNPALASMVFGSMPSSTELSPSSPQSEAAPSTSSPQDRAASHILVNVDFRDLVFFYHQSHRTWGDASLELLREVISEREAQRTKIVSNRIVPNKQRMANSSAWDVAAYHEYVQNGELRRERVSFLLPTKQ
ncbi:uncharacterized protein HMPREF1541_02598 [Cyphellophora europaea CBS 101466]|uniref:BTB domain-containing protein n=1 Tax=Cyphellophora europaea (strain CBS 101466) TaxID=1220924 RepID=W2S697_CYPE1|nr:uncharacterized protein HMPREF1541_02598 [Cyphellophora europaea CBS 101466]ETN43439.1 hypothetical protein HMPREF1541_02598 [Cyphellophora europaea CBS 101466]